MGIRVFGFEFGGFRVKPKTSAYDPCISPFKNRNGFRSSEVQEVDSKAWRLEFRV